MGFFKEMYCADCGKKANVLGRMPLKDGKCLCFGCFCRIPALVTESLGSYTLEEYQEVKNYLNTTNRELRNLFQETISYRSLHLDEENKILYIGKQIDAQTIFLYLGNLENFDLAFDPESMHQGILNDSVSGRVLFELDCRFPRFHYQEILAKDVKAPAKKKMFGTKLEYGNPKGMDEFLDAYCIARLEILETEQAQIEEDLNYLTAKINEREKAMAVFMIDDLTSLTLNDLKLQRNRLMKAYHPDKGSAADTRYAQKINDAYEILKSALEEN